MKRKKMYIEVSYVSEPLEDTKIENKKERKRVLNYIKDLIDSDFHDTFKIKVKELIFEE